MKNSFLLPSLIVLVLVTLFLYMQSVSLTHAQYPTSTPGGPTPTTGGNKFNCGTCTNGCARYCDHADCSTGCWCEPSQCTTPVPSPIGGGCCNGLGQPDPGLCPGNVPCGGKPGTWGCISCGCIADCGIPGGPTNTPVPTTPPPPASNTPRPPTNTPKPPTSTPRPTATSTPIPAPPIVCIPGSGNVRFNWPGLSGISSYWLQLWDSVGNWFVNGWVGNITSYTQPANVCVNYSAHVQATDWIQSSPWSNTATCTPVCSTPPPPTGKCRYDPLGNVFIDWSWSPTQSSALEVWDQFNNWYFNNWTSSPYTLSNVVPLRTYHALTTYNYCCYSAIGSISCLPPPPPQPPTNLNPSCGLVGNKATLTWNPSIGASSYAIRASNTSNGWNLPVPPVLRGDVADDNAVSPYSFSSFPGHTYQWWAFAIGLGGWSSAAHGPDFTCSMEQLSQPQGTCGPYNILTDTFPITWTWSAPAAGTYPTEEGGAMNYKLHFNNAAFPDVWTDSDNSNPITSYTLPNGPANTPIMANVSWTNETNHSVVSIPSNNSAAVTCIPPPWYKLVNTSFNKFGMLFDPIPVTRNKFDGTSDDPSNNPYLVDNSANNNPGLVLHQDATPDLGVGVFSNPLQGWHRQYTPSLSTITDFKNYVRSRKENIVITTIDSSLTSGIYIYQGTVPLTISQSEASHIVNAAPIVLIIDENTTIDVASQTFNNSLKSVAIIVNGTLTIGANMKELNGVYIANQVDFGTSTTPLKIGGNIISFGGANPQVRARADTTQPSILVVFKPNMYLDLLPYLSTATYDWKQLQ